MAIPSDEKEGAWFYYAKGSGIWFNLGTTLAFETHSLAFEHFFNATERYNKTSHELNMMMCARAAKWGIDSVQFTKNAPQDCIGHNDTVEVVANMNYELVSTRLEGLYPCASATGRSPLLRSGWHAHNNCTCNNSAPVLGRWLYCEEIRSGLPRKLAPTTTTAVVARNSKLIGV